MPLSEAEINERLTQTTGWQRDGDALTREFRFGDFRAALAFLVRVGFEAEQRDHHPEISNVYNRVTLRLWTHTENGITDKDFDLARAIDALGQG
jgi:4a-hydroxytetrahydrobiopterin dehydratase